MKQIFIAAASLFMMMLLSSHALASDIVGKDADREMDRFIDGLMSRMTLEEKAGQLSLVTWDRSLVTGDTQSAGVAEKIAEGRVGGVFNVASLEERLRIQKHAVENSRLGIPLIFGLDVVHGFRTIFPIPLALSCSWDMDLIERTAAAAADEASSEGIDWTYSPMVDIVRDPRWGRVAESSGGRSVSRLSYCRGNGPRLPGLRPGKSTVSDGLRQAFCPIRGWRRRERL